MNKIKFTLSLIALVFGVQLSAQPYIVDKVVGVVGKSAILYSDVEEQYLQLMAQREKPEKCMIFEDLLAQKLMVNQAEKDSVEVSFAEVEMELEQRISYFIQQIGSEDKLVAYFGKSILEIKDDMREPIREQLLMQRMQSEIVKDISITPNEVKTFYNKLNKDSLPYIDSQVELSQILIYPESDQEAVFAVREKLLGLRERILNGESFATMAVLYSDCPSAPNGGDIGWANKADLDPAYAKAAMALKKDQVSKIVESSFGYHIIQLMDKTDDRVRTRHILMKPKVSPMAKQKAISQLDSIARLIRQDSLKFEIAARLFSQDDDTRVGGGLKVNPATLSTQFLVTDFETSEYYVIRNLQVGEISKPYEATDEKGRTVYKIVKLKSRTEPHVANLKLDYDLLQNMALQEKQINSVDEWIKIKAKDIYIRLEPPYSNCQFRLDVWK